MKRIKETLTKVKLWLKFRYCYAKFKLARDPKKKYFYRLEALDMLYKYDFLV